MEIQCRWLEKPFVVSRPEPVQISVVVYEHELGLPARFCAGLIPAIELSRMLGEQSIAATIRVIDPSPIAANCNGWSAGKSRFQEVAASFLRKHGAGFFFDQAEPVTENALGVLGPIAKLLEEAEDPAIIDMIGRIKESGRRHGGEAGENNALLYMAAHPFSWLDMHHPAVWKRRYDPAGCRYVNLMSQSEARFTAIRRYLAGKAAEFHSGLDVSDCYMTICDTPCYIPLEDEPLHDDLASLGPEWCLQEYKSLKKRSGNHRRALKDFEALLSFAPCSET